VSTETPVEATEYLLTERLPGPLFNAQAFGSYLIWAAQPDYPVFVDTRLELHPLETWLDYLEISGGRGDWEGLLAKYGINTLMLSPDEQAALYNAALASPDWRLAYSDDRAYLFVRSGSN
jgi:hypothetical protein